MNKRQPYMMLYVFARESAKFGCCGSKSVTPPTSVAETEPAIRRARWTRCANFGREHMQPFYSIISSALGRR
jgi:hypothetical protein